MELELKKEQFACYQALPQLSENREETTETIVPDYPCLQSLQAEECEKKEKNVPSLVLRAMKPGERLWDIAKRYRTTVEAILAANELKEEPTAVSGKLLLIPRRR